MLILQVQLIAGPTKPASVLSKQSARNLELTAVLQLRTRGFSPVLTRHGASLRFPPLDVRVTMNEMMTWRIGRWRWEIGELGSKKLVDSC